MNQQRARHCTDSAPSVKNVAWCGVKITLSISEHKNKRAVEKKKKRAHYSLCQSRWWRRWLMRLGFLNKQLLSMWCSPLPLRLARVDSQRFVFAAPLRPAPSSIAPFHGPFSTTICSRPHRNNPLKTTGLQSTTATQWIAPLSRISISGPRSFLCSLSNYAAWTVGRVGIKRGRWLWTWA